MITKYLRYIKQGRRAGLSILNQNHDKIYEIYGQHHINGFSTFYNFRENNDIQEGITHMKKNPQINSIIMILKDINLMIDKLYICQFKNNDSLYYF